MILPPPNITGNLHLGHALTVTLQDAFLRFHKMKGYDTSWIPGYDHAGIATQLILDRIVSKQAKTTTANLSEKEFQEIASMWRDERMTEIRKQLESLGACLDFDKQFYTLSPQMSESVRTAFIKLFNDGMIYRKKRPVNWSYFLKSTLSDMEVKWSHMQGPTCIMVPGHNEPVEFGFLHKFSYPLANDMSGRNVIVATTRMDTVIGDVAVVVHPDDDSYTDLIGRQLLHPLTGAKIPIIADKRIEMDFGSGAMKLTPAHSQVDYEIALDHNLVTDKHIYDDTGCISCPDLRPQYAALNGMNRFAAKDKVVEMLNHLGLYRGSEPHTTRVPLCERSGDVIEIVLKDQWFVKVEEATQQLRKDVETGKMRVIPENYKQVWLTQWLDPQHSHEWCISRQIRWGHPIPAYQVTVNGKATDRWVAAKDEADALRQLPRDMLNADANVAVVQDNDVLDTWFSSSLLPFTVFGWPEVDPNPLPEYPLSVLETGYDILGCWVHRMALMSRMITGRYGFDKVFLHAMVGDANGKKMTKSLGNVIDPIDVIKGITLPELWAKSEKLNAEGLLSDEDLEKAKQGQQKLMPKGIPECGADGLRLSLIQADVKTQAIRLNVTNIAHNGRLMNKMWNAYRFFELMSKAHDGNWSTRSELKDKHYSSPVDRWILSRTSRLVTSANNFMDSGDLHLLYTAFHQFWINELCDVYIEFVKHSTGPDAAALSDRVNVLRLCMQTAFSCIHPIIPFITEELYQRSCSVDGGGKSILESGFPEEKWWKNFSDTELDQAMTSLCLVLTKLRSLRDQMRSKQLPNLELGVKSTHPKPMIELAVMLEKEFRPDSLSFQELNENEKERVKDPNWLEYVINEKVTLLVKPTDAILSISIHNVRAKLDRVNGKIAATKSRPRSEWTIQKVSLLLVPCYAFPYNLLSLFSLCSFFSLPFAAGTPAAGM